ncbi:MAG: replication-associated recombination protein A [Acidobacteria bacterium]|nr:MAG: replication-associated recombination protein A [Acidobacteriota bacterium]
MSRSLFDDQESSTPQTGGRAPLADRVRPTSLEEIVGQDELVGSSGFLRRAIEQRRVPSLIFWGPPGSGKTTLARIIADRISCRFVPFSAVTSGIKEVKQVMAEASILFRDPERRTLLFVDEIHRFNRAQQDAFLPYVERGDIVLIGATTENPSFALNAALMSRCRVVVLQPLDLPALEAIVERALTDPDRGLGASGVELTTEARQQLVQLASGDARKALNLLELAVEDAAADGLTELSAERVTRLAQKKVLLYDKSGEEHFNLISALHKSLRESDPDAALYWLARMLEAGEDPLYVARRMTRFASEDVGLADPQALPQTLAAWDTYHRLGSPEGELALAQAALYLALAPKSNAVYRAYSRVRRTLAEQPADPVPMALRNAPTRLMEEVGYGDGYVYAHDTDEGVGGLDCLPESLQGTRFYEPKGGGFEEKLAERLERFRALREKARKTKQ